MKSDFVKPEAVKPPNPLAGAPCSAMIGVFATMPDGERRHERYPSRCAAARGIREARAKGGYDINVFDPWLPKSPNDSGERPATSGNRQKPMETTENADAGLLK